MLLLLMSIRNKVSYNPLDFKLDDTGNQTDLTEIVLDDNGHKVVGDDSKSRDLTKGASRYWYTRRSSRPNR